MRILITAILIAALCKNSFAQEEIVRVRVGTLTCATENTSTVVTGSLKQLSCTFRKMKPKSSRVFRGEILRRNTGTDIIPKSIFVWNVWAPKENSATISLIGKYFEPTVGKRMRDKLGENALMGGQKRSLILEPVLQDGVQGAANIFVDIVELELRPARI